MTSIPISYNWDAITGDYYQHAGGIPEPSLVKTRGRLRGNKDAKHVGGYQNMRAGASHRVLIVIFELLRI